MTGKDKEPSELIYFKVYKSQIPVIERAIEAASLMLGLGKSRGYCLEMICADFLAGASIEGDNPEILLQSISRYFKFLPTAQQVVQGKITGEQAGDLAYKVAKQWRDFNPDMVDNYKKWAKDLSA